MSEYGIVSTGAGQNLREAADPAYYRHGDNEYILLAFGWKTIQCPLAKISRAGVNPLIPSHVINSVKEIRKQRPNGKIIVYMHWNYELELHPQPADRQLAHVLIDLGVEAVIGSHSHCVQGIEVYKGKPIVYSLGNWLIPHGTYYGIDLKYPEFTNRQLAFEWNDHDMICHWFHYDSINDKVKFFLSESLESSQFVKELTPYHGMKHKDYIEWFKKNRRRKKLLPIYRDYKSKKINQLKDKWVAIRPFALQTLRRVRALAQH